MEKGVASEELKDVCSPGTQKKLECRIFSHFYPHLSDDEDRLRRFLFAINIHQFYGLRIVWWCLSKRINFSHFISELKRSTVTPSSRNMTDEN